MGELIAFHYCKKCKTNTEHMFSSSGKHGICMPCWEKDKIGTDNGDLDFEHDRILTHPDML